MDVLTPAQVNAAPDRYLGQEITVVGTLEAEGQMPIMRFFLAGDDGVRLEVDPWLPTEVVLSPTDRPAPPSMSSVTGLRLRLRGTLTERDTGLIFMVNEATEEP